jgi:hypothetical protein
MSPKAFDDTNAGFALSPHVARTSTWNPARIVLGFTIKTVAADADAAAAAQAVSSNVATIDARAIRSHRSATMMVSSSPVGRLDPSPPSQIMAF